MSTLARPPSPLTPVSPTPAKRRFGFRKRSPSSPAPKAPSAPSQPQTELPTPPTSPRLTPAKKVLSLKTWFASSSSAAKRNAAAALPPLQLPPAVPLKVLRKPHRPASPTPSRRSSDSSAASTTSNEDKPSSARWSLSSLSRRSSKDKSASEPSTAPKHRRSLSGFDWTLPLRRKSSRGSSRSSTASSSPNESVEALPSPPPEPAAAEKLPLSPPTLSPVSSFDLDLPSSTPKRGILKSRATTLPSPSSSVDFGSDPLPVSTILPSSKHGKKKDDGLTTESRSPRKRLFARKTLPPSPSPASSVSGPAIASAGSSKHGKNLADDTEDQTPSPRKKLFAAASLSLASPPLSPVSSKPGKSLDFSGGEPSTSTSTGIGMFTDSPLSLSPANTFDLGEPEVTTPTPAPKRRSPLKFGSFGRKHARGPSEDSLETTASTVVASNSIRSSVWKGKQRAASTPSPTASSSGFPDEKAENPYTFSIPSVSRTNTFDTASTSAAQAHVYPPAAGLRRRRSRKGKERATDSDLDEQEQDEDLDTELAAMRKSSIAKHRVSFSLPATSTVVASPIATTSSTLSPQTPLRPPPRRSSTGGKADTALAAASLAFRALREVADGLNIPYAKGIAGLAVLITDSVQLVTTNREACERLADHVCQVVVAIINQMSGKENISPQLKFNIQQLTDTLQKIHKFVQEQAKRTYFSRFIRSQDDVDLIKQYSDDLRHALDLFGLRSTIIIQHQLHRSTVIAQEYDNKILQTVQRNHKMYMRAIRGDDGEEIEDDVQEENVDAEGQDEEGLQAEAARSKTQLALEWEEPLLHPRPPIFYGREAIMDDILGLIAPAEDAPPSPARIAILGAPGIGKSSLALSALHNARTSARYAHRRYYVACEGVRSDSALLRRLAEHFELRVTDRMEDTRVQELVLSRLACRGERAVLVLDHFEDPWEDASEGRRDAVEKVVSAIAGIDSLSLVVVLRGAERPLGPGWTRPFLPMLGPLEHEAARDTFTALSDVADDEPTLPKLLDRCAGHPLAVTLLANIAQYDSMTALLARWEQESTSMLDRGVQSRQTNFDISIEVTIAGPRMKAVGEPALELITLLCLLPDGFSEESLGEITRALPEVGKAASVLRQTALAYDDVIDLPGRAPLPAAALAVSPAAKFLEAHKPASNDARAVRRLCVMGPIRAYFCANRKPKDDHLAVLEAHYISLAARAAKIGTAEDGETLVQVLRLEVGNMHCIIERILAKDPHRRDAVQAAADLGEFLRHTLRGSLRTSSFQLAMKAAQAIGEESLKGEWMVRAAEAARERGDVEGAAAQCEAAMNVIRDVRGQAHCLKQWALALSGTDAHVLAAQKLEEARNLYRAAADQMGVGECLLHLAQCDLTADNLVQAQTRAEEAMRVFRKHNHATWQARCQKVMGIVAQRNGNLTAAANKFSSALTLFKKAGCAPEMADALARLAEIARARCDFADALATHDDVLMMVRGFGPMPWGPRAPMPFAAAVPAISASNRTREAHSLLELGNLALSMDSIDRARSRFEEAQAIFNDHKGELLGQAACAVAFGDLSFRMNDPEAALAHYSAARTTYRRVASPRSEADVLAKMGDAQHAMKANFEAGLVAHVTALALYRKTRSEHGIASELRWLGDRYSAEAAPKPALAAYHVAGSLCRRATEWRLSAEVHSRVGDVCLGVGYRDGARVRYERSFALYKKGNDARAMQRCQEKIDELAQL
ncbi:hypothetical protein AURDEDRAFT_187528 [Auricularia subglabra TFB-10046 SS5]|uniref:Novel STAND NTPase 1 domain-containing protein n=1 Tax=Auricularia subglabra (strain TFB-10046 / SS5) TaxID=717982 RepID=J0DBU3_AURST|nr:hypothetical protein AURDEDRAFT_187528 [Auricularia subglabra TFB-10046 SS5]